MYATRRDKYDYQLRSLRLPGGVGLTTDYHHHKIRREALAPFFSKRNVLHLEDIVTAKVEQLKNVIGACAAKQVPVNLSDAFFAFSNESASLPSQLIRAELTVSSVVTNFLFAHQANNLADVAQAATLRQDSKELLMGIHFNKHFPQISNFLESIPVCISRFVMPAGVMQIHALFGVSLSRVLGTIAW